MAGLFGGRATPAPMPFRRLSRRSGRISALPYPPPRYSQGGRHQPRRAMIFQRTAITPLTSCLTPGVHFIWIGSLLLPKPLDFEGEETSNPHPTRYKLHV